MSLKAIILSAILSVATLGAANAATVTVDSKLNSSNTGVGAVAGLILNVGQSFRVTADVLDTWSLGANDPGCTRESNANGLTACFGNYTQAGSMLSALFGTLVGRIGSGDYFVIGSNFSGTAATAGALTLYNWDSNADDNSGSITAVASVPLPAGGLLLLGALGGLAVWRRRKTV